jgi:hypothetical protein
MVCAVFSIRGMLFNLSPPMRGFLQRPRFCRQTIDWRACSVRNIGSTTTGVLYALTVASSPARPAPEDALHKSHHAKSGFRNPWE